MGLLGKFTEKTVQIENIDREGYKSFNTPFLKVGTGNLSLPTIWDRYQRNGYVPFGDDNLYPQLLNQMYFASPLHGAVVDFKVQASVGGGYEVDLTKLTAEEKVRYYAVGQWLNLDKAIQTLAFEQIIHERIFFIVTMVGGKATKFQNVGAEKVRTNKEKSQYFVSEDYLNNSIAKAYKPYDRKCKDGQFMLCFETVGKGQDIYALPRYISALNFAFLSGELSYFSKSNIQNSVFPSFAMLFPKKPQTTEEMNEMRDTVGKMKGAENAGKAVAFFANGKENLPEISSLPANDNANLFTEASNLNTEQICFAHTIDPILMGVRTSGSLGNGSDIKQSYIIFEKNVITPIRKRIEEIINTLFDIAGVRVNFSLVNYQIINEAIVEVSEDKTVTTLNSLSPLLATKVLSTMTPNETRALVGLAPIEGGDVIPSETPVTFTR